MVIRTISQLPRTDNINDDSLIEVSINRDNKYISKAITYKNIETQLSEAASNAVALQFKLKNDAQANIDVNALNTKVNNIAADRFEFTGKKTFRNDVYLENGLQFDKTDKEDDTRAATTGYVQQAILNIPTFIGNKSIPTGFVATDGSYNGEIMQFMFNGTGQGSRNSTVCKCSKSGNLTMYGWLADNGNVDTAAAWVALEALVGKSEQSGGQWVIIALQPWIIGQKHSNLQYVGFNVPVSENTELRVTTGFDLNFTNSTYQSRANSLVKNVQASTAGVNITNAFLGYIFF